MKADEPSKFIESNADINGKLIEDDADKVTSIAEFHFEYRDNSARGAVLYSNGWNQAPATVRLLLWDKDNQPVKLSQDALLKDSRLKFFLKDGTQLVMKPVSDQNTGLTYWNVAGDYDKVVQYTPSICFIKPIARSLNSFNTVELEVLAAAPDATPLKKLVVSYLLNGEETEIDTVACNTSRVNWQAKWCLPAGDVTLKATAIDSEDNAVVTTHLLSIPTPKDKSWVVINHPLNNSEFSANDKLPVNVSFQAKDGHRVTGIALSFDGESIENINTNASFVNKNYTITMSDYTAQLTAALWSSDNEEQRHAIYLSPQTEINEADSTFTQDDNESIAVVYFSTAETGATYDIYAQLDLPNVAGSTENREQLGISTWQSINYSDVNFWTQTAQEKSDKHYFNGFQQRPDCYIFNQEFRYEFIKEHPAFKSIKNSGAVYSGGSYGYDTNFPLLSPASALIGIPGNDFLLNLWTPIWKPHDYYYYAGYGGGAKWNLYAIFGDPENLSYVFNDEYFIDDKTQQPYTYFSVSLIQICCPDAGSRYKTNEWSNVINNSVFEISDIYGNHGIVTVGYKDDSSIPYFPGTH
ncbi:hypothetical protein [Winslowiella iniecta]|uniref:Uncharacterized protein n=1 Tax=Winslowiella iniecta TaxID=1560201 RepID=A0A0L7TI62_9GAMM|nr:hypothetical protein [Winslowiella iniecta]KOC91810.1 hypothetical protein NG42_03335 [Winslowiella iniecta]KOC95062.1 hypothetical protein NG43_02380 [Winslowiella iniecta]